MLALDSGTELKREIVLVDLSSGARSTITQLDGFASFPSWSPDGSRLSFYVYQNQTTDLWTVNNDGTRLLQMTRSLASEMNSQCTFACHAAASQEALSAVSTSFSGGKLETRGPSGGDSWLVYYVILAPRGAEIEAEASNGPLSFDGVSGKITARGQNGPIGFKDCSGTIDAQVENGPISLDRVSGDVTARADNGPISIHGGSGNVRAKASNGPVSVRLSGDSWHDGTLEARSVNGPLSLKIPDGYRSRAVVEASGHSPFRCRAAACGSARRTSDDEDRRVEFGDGSPVVQLSTVNGPVTVDSVKAE